MTNICSLDVCVIQCIHAFLSYVAPPPPPPPFLKWQTCVGIRRYTLPVDLLQVYYFRHLRFSLTC